MTTTESVYKNRFSGKVAIITGAGSGIGKATITRFVEEGGSAVGVAVWRSSKAQKSYGFTITGCPSKLRSPT